MSVQEKKKTPLFGWKSILIIGTVVLAMIATGIALGTRVRFRHSAAAAAPAPAPGAPGAPGAAAAVPQDGCYLIPNKNGSDDAPNILQAFKDCGKDSTITFSNATFHIESVMDTRGLQNVVIDLKGTLLWGIDVQYWLNNSLPMGYQNQSTAWILGGNNITFIGNGFGTFDGNGQTWYDFVRGASNYARRPHALTISNTTNSVFRGIRFVQSQMWTMTVIHSQNVLLEDIYIRSVSTGRWGTINTDGADTIYADNITFNRWEIHNGDDAISPKANSTNILVTNSVFYWGSGIAIGSIGQYNGVYERIENFTAINITAVRTLHAVYFKTWTGQRVGYPPNGGGGGLGFIKNVQLHNFTVVNLRNTPISISQCTTFSGEAGDCNSSLFQISNVSFVDVRGTISQNPLASFQCSRAAPCRNFEISNVDVKLPSGDLAEGYRCNHLNGTTGFNCTNSTCEHPSGDGTC